MAATEIRMAATTRKVALVVGVGPGIGAAVARRFAAEFDLAIVARNETYLSNLAAELRVPGGKIAAIAADVSEGPSTVASVVARASQELGRNPDVLVYNAAMRPFGTLLETKPATFERTWRLNAFAAFLFAQNVVPEMVKRGHGTLVFTGATGGSKPAANSAAFGPAKFALRGLAQVLARDLGPKGIHVAYVNVDGAVDTPLMRQYFPSLTERDMIKPTAVAEAYWYLVHQDPSAFTQELDIRPFAEKF